MVLIPNGVVPGTHVSTLLASTLTLPATWPQPAHTIRDLRCPPMGPDLSPGIALAPFFFVRVHRDPC